MDNPDFIYGIEPGPAVYDIETYCNTFTLSVCQGQKRWHFEISFRRNDVWNLVRFLDVCQAIGVQGVGFNNYGFDYPVLHMIHQHPHAVTVEDIYNKAMAIIKAPDHARFSNMVWDDQQVFQQIDLFKIHHFDNRAKATSLKVLEFNMRLPVVEDLPFPVGINLTSEQIDKLIEYNDIDVDATLAFMNHSQGMIDMRRRMSEKFGINMMNMSDVKVGETIMIRELENRGVQVYEWVDGRKKKRQTQRDKIIVADILLPHIQFENQALVGVLNQFRDTVIVNTKGDVKFVVDIDNLTYTFGSGGIHASMDKTIVRSDDSYQIVDVDVAGYYPNNGIANGFYPAHLGEAFCDAHKAVVAERSQYKKGTPENESYKLAGNAAFGNSNNEYSVFFDPQYTMSITINGQLLLAMLVEQLIKVPGLRMIQANTDGVTYHCPIPYLEHTRNVCRWWETMSKLTLEENLYDSMMIRDVNNYMAVKQGGKIKRIGAYAYETALENPGTRELPWHKDWSFRVVAKAAEAHLVHGRDIMDFLRTHDDLYDFMGRTKVPRSSTLECDGQQVANIIRYYLSMSGGRLEKVMPAAGPVGAYKRANGVPDHIYNAVIEELQGRVTAGFPTDGTAPTYDQMSAMIPWDERIHTKNQSRYEERRIGIHTGQRVTICNDMRAFDWDAMRANINYHHYEKEVRKLCALQEL